MVNISRDIILPIIFIASFVVYIGSAFGIGDATRKEDEPLKIFARNSATLSLAGMLISWIFLWGFQTPGNEKSFTNLFNGLR
jgi:hypothetical protein